MSIKLFYSNKIENLSEQLVENINIERRENNDPFQSSLILVPNFNVQKWLKLQISQLIDVCINIDFKFFENGLWYLIDEIYDKSSGEISLLDNDKLHVIILYLLLNSSHNKNLTALNRYLTRMNSADILQRDMIKKSFQLSRRLARIFREYEYNRPKMIEEWNKKENYFRDNDIEISQRTLYNMIFGHSGILDKVYNNQCLTLPEFMNLVLKGNKKVDTDMKFGNYVHLFGLSQISQFHRELLFYLSEYWNLIIYELNICGEFWEDITTPNEDKWIINKLKLNPETYQDSELWDIDENMLLKAWGKPGRESVKLMSVLEERFYNENNMIYDMTWLYDDSDEQPDNILHTIQYQILKRTSQINNAGIEQDKTLQIIGCPGIYREIDTVYNSIIYNMDNDKTLNLNEIAILVPDMNRYKPFIRMVFDENKYEIPYSLIDSTADKDSEYGKGVLALIELLDGEFTRENVFNFLSNKCFLLKHDITTQTLNIWIEWIDSLNVYHSFDAEDKTNNEYQNDFLYTWEQGLLRLKFGRIMDAPDVFENVSLSYKNVLPYSSMTSGEHDVLERFCIIIESLFNHINRIKSIEIFEITEWISLLKDLLDDYLGIDESWKDEIYVKNTLYAGLSSYEQYDSFIDKYQGIKKTIPIQVIIEIIKDSLVSISSGHGRYLSRGVSISTLKPMRPIPFKIVYILGLNEGRFPGSNVETSLDLRWEKRRMGDITNTEANRYLFLETLISVRQKLYLSYVSRDLQRDKKKFPCSIIKQLITYIDEYILPENVTFDIIDIPLTGFSERYYNKKNLNLSYTDVYIDYSKLNRLIALSQLLKDIKNIPVKKEKDIHEEINKIIQEYNHDMYHDIVNTVHISTRDLCSFLQNPVESKIKKHLKIYDDFDEPDLTAHEPFTSDRLTKRNILKHLAEYYIHKFYENNINQDIIINVYKKLYEYYKLQSATPSGAFGDMDYDDLHFTVLMMIDKLYEILNNNKSYQFIEGIMVGQQQITSSYRFKPYIISTLTLSDINIGKLKYNKVDISGINPYLWYNKSENKIITLELNPYSTSRKVYFLNQIIFNYIILLIYNKDNSVLPFDISLPVIFEMNILYLQNSNQKSITMEIESIDEVKKYIDKLIRDYLDITTYDLLPLEIIMQMKKNGQLDMADIPALKEDILNRFKKSLKDEWQMTMELLEILELEVSDDIEDIIKNRLEPVMEIIEK